MPVGSWVLREVCRQLSTLQPVGAADDWFVSVNVSVQQLHAPGFLAEVFAALEHSDVDPRRLLLEVTETALEPGEHVLTVRLLDLADLGQRVALDDFGTGFCSLSHLEHPPAQVLEIDRSFVAGVTPDCAQRQDQRAPPAARRWHHRNTASRRSGRTDRPVTAST